MSSGPAPGLDYHSRSFSTDKIDHLLSAPAPTPTEIPLEVTDTRQPRSQRYSYDIKPDANTVSVATSKPQWRPLALSRLFIGANVALLVVMAVLVELWYWMNVKVHGLVPSHFVQTHDSFVPYLNVLPGECNIPTVSEYGKVLTASVRTRIHVSRPRSPRRVALVRD